jgi:hypothetical protein
MPFAAMISRLPSAIAEGSAWPPNRLLPMIRKRPFGPTACQAASFWFECSAAHTQGMSWSSSEAGQRLMSRVSTSAK